jgi:uncharacterized membrane protein YidH (DUF202 family)
VTTDSAGTRTVEAASDSAADASGGLQQERTTLAWQRTALSFGVIAVLVAHHGRQPLGSSALRLASAGVLAVAGVAAAVMRHRQESLTGGRDRPPPTMPPAVAAAMTAAVVFCAVAVLAAIAFDG